MILEPEAWPRWLSEVEGDATALTRPASGEVLHLWPVSHAVSSVFNNGAELLDRIDDLLAPPPNGAPVGPNRPDDATAFRVPFPYLYSVHVRTRKLRTSETPLIPRATRQLIFGFSSGRSI